MDCTLRHTFELNSVHCSQYFCFFFFLSLEPTVFFLSVCVFGLFPFYYIHLSWIKKLRFHLRVCDGFFMNQSKFTHYHHILQFKNSWEKHIRLRNMCVSVSSVASISILVIEIWPFSSDVTINFRHSEPVSYHCVYVLWTWMIYKFWFINFNHLLYLNQCSWIHWVCSLFSILNHDN